MKLLFISHYGFSEEAKAFYREYVRQGVDLAVIVPSKIILQETHIHSGGYFYSRKDDEKGYRFFPVDLRKPESYGEGFKFFQLFKTIKKINPDVIQVLDEYTSFYLFQIIICRNILYGKRVPVIVYASQNNNFHFKSPPFVFVSLKRFFKRIFRKILQPMVFHFHNKYLDGVASCNSECLKLIESAGGKMPKELIFYGVDFSVFYPKNRNLCREKLGIPRDIKLVGNIGRFDEEKGLQNLIKAASRLDEYYLMLLGGGSYELKLQDLIDSLRLRKKFFHFKNIGRRDLVDYYNVFDVFVLPSLTTLNWKEQYGRVLVEAMACGLPVVGSSSGAIPEVLEGYPKGLIFKEGDVNDLVEKIKEAETLRFPENFNLEDFLYKFGVENFVKKHIKFYYENIF